MQTGQCLGEYRIGKWGNLKNRKSILRCLIADVWCIFQIRDLTSYIQNPHTLVYNLHFRWKTDLFKVSNVETARTNTPKTGIWPPTSAIFPILLRVNAQWNKRAYRKSRYVYSFINRCGLLTLSLYYRHVNPWRNMLIKVDKPQQVNFALWG